MSSNDWVVFYTTVLWAGDGFYRLYYLMGDRHRLYATSNSKEILIGMFERACEPEAKHVELGEYWLKMKEYLFRRRARKLAHLGKG